MLIEIIYTSVPAQAGVDIDSILEIAHRENPKNGITGLLCFDGVRFIQILEGEEKAVDNLYAAIAADKRNTNVELQHRGAMAERSFDSWSMAYENIPQGLLETLSESIGVMSMTTTRVTAGADESFGARLFGLFTQSMPPETIEA